MEKVPFPLTVTAAESRQHWTAVLENGIIHGVYSDPAKKLAEGSTCAKHMMWP
jgi:hypothetical protein